MESFQKGLPAVLFILIGCVCLIGVEKTEGAIGIAAKANLKGYMRHTRAYLTAGDKRACTYGLVSIMETQARDASLKTLYLCQHIRFFAVQVHG